MSIDQDCIQVFHQLLIADQILLALYFQVFQAPQCGVFWSQVSASVHMHLSLDQSGRSKSLRAYGLHLGIRDDLSGNQIRNFDVHRLYCDLVSSYWRSKLTPSTCLRIHILMILLQVQLSNACHFFSTSILIFVQLETV